MPLTNDQYSHVYGLLDDLKPYVRDMKDVPANFTREMLTKRDTYGINMFISPKQIAWLERLHDEFCGTRDPDDSGGGEGPDTDDPRFSGEADDIGF